METRTKTIKFTKNDIEYEVLLYYTVSEKENSSIWSIDRNAKRFVGIIAYSKYGISAKTTIEFPTEYFVLKYIEDFNEEMAENIVR